MQIAIVLHLRQLIFVVVSHICFSTIMQSFACFPAVTASAREKANIRKISLFNGNIHTKKANTCNWMLMSTEYSLLSGKETSRCFYSVAWCIYTLLFPLFGQFVVCVCVEMTLRLRANCSSSGNKFVSHINSYFSLFFLYLKRQKLQRQFFFEEIIWNMEAASILLTKWTRQAKWVAANWSINV